MFTKISPIINQEYVLTISTYLPRAFYLHISLYIAVESCDLGGR